jgi:hypothetical protein
MGWSLGRTIVGVRIQRIYMADSFIEVHQFPLPNSPSQNTLVSRTTPQLPHVAQDTWLYGRIERIRILRLFMGNFLPIKGA